MAPENLLNWFKAPVVKLGRRLLDALARRIAARIQAGAASSATMQTSPPPTAETSIALDYPVRPQTRWGNAWGLPAHAALEKIVWHNEKTIIATLETIAGYRKELRNIPTHAPEDHDTPRWINGWLPRLDGAALYALVRARKPAVYWEVGSGNSTRFVKRAVIDGSLPTRIVSIDPSPRTDIDQLCDEVLRAPLEDICTSLQARIGSGDMIFIDCSHRAFQNSDVTVAMLELLPTLPPDVVIGFHDIFLPDDYPPAWATRYYNEQYLLAMFLLGGHAGMEIILPSWAVSKRPDMAAWVEAIWKGEKFAEVERHGGAFWLRSLSVPVCPVPLGSK